MKKLATIAGTVALFAATLVPALAVGNECTNSTTGPLSNNICMITNTTNVTVNNVNDAVIKNDVKASSNTGGNEASMNTLGGMIVTGNATLNGTVSNVANVNTTKITGGAAASGNLGGNSITGPYSNNEAWITNAYEVELYNSNTATVDNRVEAFANTGENRANTNTGPASVSTGNALVGLMVGTHVNDSYSEIASGAGGTGGNIAENSTTGPFSSNLVMITNSNRARVNNVNDMVVENDVEAGANSGYNEAKTNTLGGEIVTGNAGAGVGVDTEGNINTTLVSMALGGFTNHGSNSVTGPAGEGGDPEIFITNTQDIVVDNWNNKCESHNADRLGRWFYLFGIPVKQLPCDPSDLGVFNDVEVVADTGNNLANTNTGGGGVLAGYADLLQQVMVHMNDSLTQISW